MLNSRFWIYKKSVHQANVINSERPSIYRFRISGWLDLDNHRRENIGSINTKTHTHTHTHTSVYLTSTRQLRRVSHTPHPCIQCQTVAQIAQITTDYRFNVGSENHETDGLRRKFYYLRKTRQSFCLPALKSLF